MSDLSVALMDDLLRKQLQLYENRKHAILAGNLLPGVFIVYFTYPATNHEVALSWIITNTIYKHDALTHMPNRRYFLEQFNIEWQRAMRRKTPITMMILDIDFFKKINDTYGHNKGDKCLQAIGNILKEAVQRRGDFVARVGGEEFAIMLANDSTDSS